MVEPHDPDHGEANDVCGQRRPALGQVVGEVAVVVWFCDRDDEERDGEREDPIAEGFHP